MKVVRKYETGSEGRGLERVAKKSKIKKDVKRNVTNMSIRKLWSFFI